MINKLIELCLKNRFLIICFYLLVIFGGVFGLKNINMDVIPDIGENQCIIFTDWPGRSPQDVEDQVTYPLTVNLLGVPGVKVIRSQSGFGFSMIFIVFQEKIDFYWARSRVLERLNFVQALLPKDVVPRLGPDATGLGQIFWYTVEGEGYDLGQLRSIQDWFIRYQLNAVEGVSEVAGVGGFVRQYQVDVDPNKLLAYRLTVGNVYEAVRKSNIDVGAKVVESNNMEFIVRGLGFIKNVSDIENITVGSYNGVPIFVKNVGIVQVGGDFRRGALDKEGAEVAGGIVLMRQGQNPLEVIKRIKKKMKEIAPGLPPGVKIVPFYDREGLIYRVIDTLREALIEEIIITSLVVAIFLLHVRSIFICCLGFPISILVSFLGMYFMGIDSNIMSLTGIAIAIGEVSDMSIVMTENIFRNLIEQKDKKSRPQIILDASKEVGSSIFFAALTTIFMFFPVFGLTGQEGKLFKPLAWTKTFAIGASVVMAITLVPILCTFLLKGKLRPMEENFSSRMLLNGYQPVLRWVLDHKKTFLAIPLAIVVSSVFVAKRIGREFMPPLDEGSILFMPVMLPSVALTDAFRVMQKQDMIIKSFPEIDIAVGKLGRAETPTDPAPVEMFETVVTLKPREEWRKKKIEYKFLNYVPPLFHPLFHWILPDERTITKQELIKEMDEALRIPGVANIWTQPIINRVDMLATGIRTSVGVKIFGTDLNVLQQLAIDIEKALQDVPGVADLYAERITGKPYLEYHIKREEIARYGINIQDVQDVIESAIGGENISTTVEGRERYPIRVRYARELRDNFDALKKIYVPSSGGQRIPITQVTDIRYVMGPAMISSENALLRAYVLMNVRGKDPMSFVEEASRVVSQKVMLPHGYFVQWSGQFENQIRARKRLQILVPLSMVVGFLLIFMAFKSFPQTMFILFAGIPTAIAGGVWLQYLFGYNFSVAVWVGFISIFGIVDDDSVLITTYINDLFGKRKMKSIHDIRDTILMAGTRRIRPCVMTAATTFIGLIPILWETGAGAEVAKPMAIPSIGGMAMALVSVFIIPCLNAWHKERKFLKAVKQNPGIKETGVFV
ncbi:cation transporter [Candidatus Brocadia sapporoensis]|uniref:Cation transporter n=1 Tax=Candidatus Brocadia sapporoensis TaxID=392547 RepID=A0A1V6M0C6_9BACT|nr:efflux RND transporter permease subunit [Candidatus Brocadia sapporoensis]MDG6005624.1 efflux RND transporter permease subunit [Candidatus Brocadia sp.]OQD45862.1 cation transporter [Candidatus Brocadia sapporoensis]GJQ22769.1 MAG: cation transporter [Candidatus Brocadia sapporoensis]